MASQKAIDHRTPRGSEAATSATQASQCANPDCDGTIGRDGVVPGGVKPLRGVRDVAGFWPRAAVFLEALEIAGNAGMLVVQR